MSPALRFAFGHSYQVVEVPEDRLLGVFSPLAKISGAGEAAILARAMANPVGTPRLRNLVDRNHKIVVIISDLTRPCPSDRLLPVVLDELDIAGVTRQDVTVVVALGLHRAMSDAELEQLVGRQILTQTHVINHDPTDTVWLGETGRGTPVEIFRPVAEADLRICIGNIEFHYFAGYSGGAKAILPGCASSSAVKSNHSLMIKPGAAAGRIAENPVRNDLEEAAAMVGASFMFNAIVDSNHRVMAAVAGELTAAHRQGCTWVDEGGRVDIDQAVDIVLVSTGGFPKDINLYQSQKALDNAAVAVRDGGIVILLAECREGFGNLVFEQWLRDASDPDRILQRIRTHFVLGGHKAAAVAKVLKRADIFLVSKIPPESVMQCGMHPFSTGQAALDEAIQRLGANATVALFPQGSSVLPTIMNPK